MSHIYATHWDIARDKLALALWPISDAAHRAITIAADRAAASDALRDAIAKLQDLRDEFNEEE